MKIVTYTVSYSQTAFVIATLIFGAWFGIAEHKAAQRAQARCERHFSSDTCREMFR